jgi:TonB family protein
MSSPDPLHPIPRSLGTFQAEVDESVFQADFADLAARFSAQSGGGLPADLSVDLALEIVLNEIVEQACLATGATGAAIVLLRDGELICRATTGATAPQLGARLDKNLGLSGECLKSKKTQISDDLGKDPRADAEASKQLGIASAMMMPLIRGEEVVGIFELFSSEPKAFGERDQMTLEALSRRTITNLERAADPSKLRLAKPSAAEARSVEPTAAAPIFSTAVSSPRRRFDVLTIALATAVIFAALLMGALLGRRWLPKKASPPSSGLPTSGASLDSNRANNSEGKTSEEGQPKTTVPADSVQPGGLRVYQDGKEVFQMPPTQSGAKQGSPSQAGNSIQPFQLSPSDAESSLLHRVEPAYPPEALQQHLQGAVVLDVHIGKDGAVQDVEVIRGAPLLVAASANAVKQWKFKPQLVKGRAVEMETTVTLNFSLPSDK